MAERYEISGFIESVLKNKGAAFFYTPPRTPGSSYFFPAVEKSLRFAAMNAAASKVVTGLLKKNYTAYSLCDYEGGYSFEPALFEGRQSKKEPFRFFFAKHENVITLPAEMLSYKNAEKSLRKKRFAVREYRIDTARSAFKRDIRRIKQYIAAGETYQINYTVRAGFVLEGDAANYIYHLLHNQSAAYTAIINTGRNIIISLSPELFFTVHDEYIETRPMKGTIRRGYNAEQDAEARTTLRKSDKERAENVMIVDLLRNDAGRVCETGSVRVSRLFKIEKYESLYQMTSTVSGKVNDSRLHEIFRAMFPCGSVTGAPKIRSMQIIRELESTPRGLYTGAIGLLTKERAMYNVAIRTITLNKETRRCKMGLGGGIVWDSEPEQEYREAVLKGQFAAAPVPAFALIETLLLENGSYTFLHEHIERLRNAARFFLFIFDKRKILSALAKNAQDCGAGGSYRVRLTLSKWGALSLESAPVLKIEGPQKVLLWKKPISSENKFQYFKTTRRGLYDRAHRDAVKRGFFDALFLNERGELAEGAITNVALKINGTWLTPPLRAGILNGIYREHLVKTGIVREATLFARDLANAEEVLVFNSVRGKVNVTVQLHD